MSEQIKSQNSELFVELSIQEQECVSGGILSQPNGSFYLFYNKTNILSKGNSEVNIVQAPFTGTSKNNTEYQFGQTTLIISGFFGDGSFLNGLAGLFS